MLGCSQLVHVAAELLYEGECLDIRTGRYKELIGDTQALAVDELFSESSL